MDSINNSPLENLQSKIANWSTLGTVGKLDKIKIKNMTAEGSELITISKPGSLQNISRGASKIFKGDLADRDGTIDWIGKFQEKTITDLKNLHEVSSNCSNLDKLESTLIMLSQLKSTIQASNQGLDNLNETYSKSKNFNEESIKKRKLINDELCKNIDSQVTEIADQVQALIADQGQALNAKFEGLRPQLIGEVQVSSQENANEDNTAYAGVELVKDFVKGKGLDTKLKTVMDAQRNTYQLPDQFFKDLPRIPHLSLNGNMIYSSREKENYDLISAYRSLFAALGSSDGAVLAVMNLTTQGMFVDPIGKIHKEANTKFEKSVTPFQDKELFFQFQIDVKDDDVTLTLKNGYKLLNSDNIEGEPLGYQLSKREFKLSLAELQALTPGDKEKTVSKVEVTDTYSQILQDHDFVVYAFLHYF